MPSPHSSDSSGSHELPTPIEQIIRPFAAFLRLQAASGILLMLCAITALVWANSDWRTSYAALWSTKFDMAYGDGLKLSKPLILWINDGLMAVFFLVVGLEIKRELVSGELASARRAALPAAAALGGMLVPALLYAAFNSGRASQPGWGIPMATDIAFSLGVLAVLGKRVPLAVKVFLTAIAIVDDLGAVVVIAIFYTAQIKWGLLAASLGFWALTWLFGRAGGRHPAVFILLGLCLWVCMLKSGVHATIAGVLLALAIPGKKLPSEADPLTERWEHALHPWVAYLIMPVFALANAGVPISNDVVQALTSPEALGIMVGLVAGKPFGIAVFAWLAVKSNLAALPRGMTWRNVIGVGCLAGIGFTMSLFIAELAFANLHEHLVTAKTGILAASLVAGILGYLSLRLTPLPRKTAGELEA